MANLIKASIFNGKKIPPQSFLKGLVVTGGIDTVKKHLAKAGWDKTEPICTPVFTLNEGDPSIKGSRWVLMGALQKPVRFKAEHVFPTAEANVIVTITFPDLSIFEFSKKNSSFWVESDELDVVIHDKTNKKDLDQAEAEAKGVGQFCARAFLIPESPASALLWIALMPFSKDQLKDKLPTDYNATNCPQVPVSLGVHGARAKRIIMMMREREKDGFGYGCFPLLETLYPGIPTLPSPSDLKESLFSFMRQVEGHNNRGGNTIVRAMENPVEVAKVDPLPHRWPALAVEEGDDEGDEGKHSFHLYCPR